MSEPRRILVVDDDPEILGVTAAVLAGASYEVATARTGADALRLARGAGWDLMLLDINMPGMDGWETLKLLKADEGTAGVPVVMFSVKGEVRDRVHGLQEGAADYITKPFGVDDLLFRVRRALENAGRGFPPRPGAEGH